MSHKQEPSVFCSAPLNCFLRVQTCDTMDRDS